MAFGDTAECHSALLLRRCIFFSGFAGAAAICWQMSEMGSDRELLGEYLRTGAEAAFRELVNRHVRMVQGTAVRVTGMPDAAPEIAQEVFITLAKKAPWLTGHDGLAGWLHRTAVHKAQGWARGEQRRRRREQQAYEEASIMQHSLSTEQLGLLDEALLGLSDDDRQLVVLRHCEGNSYPEIARQLGLREDAVRKRCDKAMEQVAACFRKRGVPVGGAALLAGLDSTALAVTPSLATTITQTAMVGAPVAAMGAIPLLAGKFLALSKVQTVAVMMAIGLVPIAYEAGLRQTARREERAVMAELAGQERALASARRELGAATTRLAQAARREAAYKAVRTSTEPPIRTIAWVAGGPYTRVAKAAVLGLEVPGLDATWKCTTPLRQLLALNAQEEESMRTSLEAFTTELARQNQAALRQATPSQKDLERPDHECLAFVVDSHTEAAKEAARALERRIIEALGTERGRMALRNFHLPLLPKGTTDYEGSPDYNNSINPSTAASQGLEWHITFHRYTGEDKKSAPYVSSKYVDLYSATMAELAETKFDHAAIPPTLRGQWEQWKTGALKAHPRP
jgi:RNA polymerase sigma factor (sigma-70 family)